MKTLFKVFSDWQLKANDHYFYNKTDGVIRFWNGSEILLKDLAEQPADPDWNRLGSLELTGAFVDEAAEISKRCKEILSSRIRHKLQEYGLTGKILLTCNPSKGWLYDDYYVPFVEGHLPSDKQFVQALPKDNPYLDASYEARLAKLEPRYRSRLLDGDWNYDTDDADLITASDIWGMFTSEEPDTTDTYISADIAGQGKDKTVIIVWRGLTAIKIVVLDKSTTPECVDAINKLATDYGVPRQRIVVDKVGLGSGTHEYLPGSFGFVANSRAVKPELYASLKTQCSFRLSELAALGKVKIICTDSAMRQAISQELAQLKQDKIDRDTKLSVIPKDKIKANIGRSPDYLDALVMRMYFELKSHGHHYRVYSL